MDEKPEKQEISRNPDGTFPKGVSGNPAGRPPGKSLKEYWRERFASMTVEEKEVFSKTVAPDLLWRMAEGNPEQKVEAKIEEPQVTKEAIERANSFDEWYRNNKSK